MVCYYDINLMLKHKKDQILHVICVGNLVECSRVFRRCKVTKGEGGGDGIECRMKHKAMVNYGMI